MLGKAAAAAAATDPLPSGLEGGFYIGTPRGPDTSPEHRCDTEDRLPLNIGS